MNWQTILYFTSILITCVLTGLLAWYAWRQPALPGVRAYAAMALCECLLALAEILSMVSGRQALALFWFNLRYLLAALIPVFWLIFALEYNGRKQWLSRRLLAGLFGIPFITLLMLLTNGLHGLWLKQEVSFYQNGPFWIAETSARIPGPGFMLHTFYGLILLLAGSGVILVAAWRKRRIYRGQALLLAAGALVTLATTMIPVFNLLPQVKFSLFTPGIGISALVYALAIFRFQFLKRTPLEESTPGMTNLKIREKNSLAAFILIFILFVSGIAVIGYVSYLDYTRQFRIQMENQISTIASLKVAELQNWRAERLTDANLFYHNNNFSDQVQFFLENPQSADAQARLLDWLEKTAAFPDYDRVFLLDVNGVERISFPAAPDPDAVPAALIDHAITGLDTDQLIFLDFHRHSENSPIHLAIMVPIFSTQDNQPLGVLVLRIDPNVYLYPLIQRWPVPSTSAETLLVRRDGDAILYLNDLRFDQNAALNLRIPLENTTVLAVKAVLGETGVVQGVDYRGVTVIGDLRAVPDSPWFLVARMDTAEVYAPLTARLWQTIIFFGMLIAVGATGLILVWRQQQVRSYRAQAQAAEALRESEAKLKTALDILPLGVSVLDADRKVVFTNPALSKILDLPEAGLVKGDYKKRKYLKADGSPMSADEFASARVLREQKAIHKVETGVVKEDGNIVWTEVSAIPAPFSDWKAVVVTTDITERKLVQDKLIASEIRYRSLFEAARDGILILDADTGVVVDVNPFLVEMLEFPRAEICGKELWELGFFKDIAANKANFLELQQNEYIRYEDLPMETAGGRKFYVEFVSNVYPVGNGRVIQCNIRDITERKQAEQALRQSEEKFSKAFLISPYAITITRAADGKFVEINDAFTTITGITREEALASTSVGLTLWAHQEDRQRVVTDLRAGRAVVGQEFLFRKKNGEIITGLFSAQTIQLNQEPCILSIINDITDRKQAEDEIRRLNADLEQRVEDRTRELREAQEQLIRQERLATLGQVAGSIGHELRNPLGVISNAIYYLKMVQPQADATIKKYLDIIENETRTSDKFITELLDFTRIKAVAREGVLVPELVRQTLERYPVPASVQVELEIALALPPVYADPHHLVQVLGNLTLNACQSMENGGKMTISAVAQGDKISIAVQDTGAGIHPENMRKLFEPLFTTKVKGIGLGLAVSRKLIEANGGSIQVQSEPGRGSTFTIYLPVFSSEQNA